MEEAKSKGLGKGGKEGSSVNGGSSEGKEASGKKEASGNQTNTQPQEKPFGANKNIHTLGCYQSSSKSITKKGNFSTFSDT